MPQKKPPPLPVFHGCERGVVCRIEAPCFTPHPWSPTHETCLFASAFMRAEHLDTDFIRSHTGDPTYLEAIEIMMKVALLNRGRGG